VRCFLGVILFSACSLDTRKGEAPLTCGPGTHEEARMCVPDEAEEPELDSGNIDETPDTAVTAHDSGHTDGEGEDEGPWAAGTIRYSTASPESMLAGIVVLASPVEDEGWPMSSHCFITSASTEGITGALVAWAVPMAFLCPTPEDEPPLLVNGGRYSLRASLYPSGDEVPLYCASDTVTVDGDVIWEFDLTPC
jgi:hypothetical protein